MGSLGQLPSLLPLLVGARLPERHNSRLEGGQRQGASAGGARRSPPAFEDVPGVGRAHGMTARWALPTCMARPCAARRSRPFFLFLATGTPPALSSCCLPASLLISACAPLPSPGLP